MIVSRTKMKPGMLNKICAHPEMVSWAIGACVLNAVFLFAISEEAPLPVILSDWQTTLFLVLALIPPSLLGFFAGMFTAWPFIRVLCSRINGAPLKAGDQVMILAGRDKGRLAEVYEITKGQGGWDLARLDLGRERKTRFTDIFEVYSLLKIKNGSLEKAPEENVPKAAIS